MSEELELEPQPDALQECFEQRTQNKAMKSYGDFFAGARAALREVGIDHNTVISPATQISIISNRHPYTTVPLQDYTVKYWHMKPHREHVFYKQFPNEDEANAFCDGLECGSIEYERDYP